VEFIFKSNAAHARICALSVFHRPYATFFSGFGKSPAIVDALAAAARPGWVTTLQDKAWDKTMKGRTIIIAVKAMLKKIPARKRRLLSPKREADVA
jgi:hypothetical protein